MNYKELLQILCEAAGDTHDKVYKDTDLFETLLSSPEVQLALETKAMSSAEPVTPTDVVKLLLPKAMSLVTAHRVANFTRQESLKNSDYDAAKMESNINTIKTYAKNSLVQKEVLRLTNIGLDAKIDKDGQPLEVVADTPPDLTPREINI